MGRAPRQLTAGIALALVVALGSSACAPITRNGGDMPVATPAGSSANTTGPPSAAAALLVQARAARAEGDYSSATAVLERALRIEPNDPALWLELGRLQYAQGDFDQAMTLARKASTLAGDDRALRETASTLIADANRERGRAAFATEREAERH